MWNLMIWLWLYQIDWQIDLPEITRRKHQNHDENLVIFHSTCYGHGQEWLSQQWRSQAANVWGHLIKLPDDMGLTEPNLWKVWVCYSCFSRSIGMLMYYVSLCIAQTYHAQKIGHPRAAITHPVCCITLSFLALVGYMAMRECRARYPKNNIS